MVSTLVSKTSSLSSILRTPASLGLRLSCEVAILTLSKEVNMSRQCEICGKEFETVKGGNTRKYCFECSPLINKKDSSTLINQKICLRRAMKKQALKLKGGKCSICGYDKCVAALEFHHLDSNEKEFKLSNGNTMSWDTYKKELEKCILVCSNCHAEIHFNDNYSHLK